MPHNLFRDRMAFVDHVPWHGHGEAVASTVTATEMCRAAGLNWEVTKQLLWERGSSTSSAHFMIGI